jgi:hypothetical protein
MAELALGTHLTLAELVRREDPNGRLADIVNTLSQVNAIIPDATWMQCNNGTYHEDTRRASEPAGAERAYDMGVTKEAGVTEKVTEPTCMLDGLSEVDAAKIRHTPDPAGARSQEDAFFLDGMTKTLASRMFSGNRATNPLQITGIDNRADYDALADDYTYDNAGGNASATVNKTSIYIIQWGAKMVNMIYPRNDAPAGGAVPVRMDDYGKQMISESTTGRKYPAYQTWFEIHFGLFIHDPRCVKRIVNISTSNIDGVDDFGFDEDVLIDAYNDLEYNGKGAVIYCNRTVFAQIQKRANDKGNANYSQEMSGDGAFAKKVISFWGIPVREVAQIANTGAKIT